MLTLEQTISHVISTFGLQRVPDLPTHDMMGWSVRALRDIGSLAAIEEVKKEILVENYTGRFPVDMSAPVRILGHEMKVLVNNTGFQTDVSNGKVTLVYHKFVTDDRGFPLVPDDEPTINAISWYIAAKLALQDILPNKKLGYDYCDSQWQWYCGQARAEGFVPTIDQWNRMVNISHRLLPPQNSYENEFMESDQRERDYLHLDSINSSDYR